MPAAPRDKLASICWSGPRKSGPSRDNYLSPPLSIRPIGTRGNVARRHPAANILSFQSGTGGVCNRLVLMRIAYENVERHAVPLQEAGKQFFSDGAQRELCRSSTRPPHRRKPIGALSPPLTIRAA